MFNAQETLRAQTRATREITEFCLVPLLATTLTLLSTDGGMGLFKPFVPVLFGMILLRVGMVLWRERKSFSGWKAVPLLCIISLYPLLRIFHDVFEEPSLKKITDGFVIYGTYYTLPFVGLAFALCVRKADLVKAITNLMWLGLPIVALLLYFGFRAEYMLYYVHALIGNYLLPISLLAVLQRNKRSAIFGFVALSAIAFAGAAIWNRTYVLMSGVLAIYVTIVTFKKRQDGRGRILIGAALLTALFLTVPALDRDEVNRESRERRVSTLEKFEWSSLGESISKAIDTRDFSQLYYWEGNSRAEILLDAFSGFTLSDWAFGRGLFATYISFIERSTIEVGWAQEVFRFGFLYTGTVILLAISGALLARKGHESSSSLRRLLACVLTLRLIECCIFGDAFFSVYTIIFYAGIMSVSLDWRIPISGK